MRMIGRLWVGACFCGGAVVALAAVYALSEAFEPVYPDMRERVALFAERSAAVEAVSVGNSHGRALDFAALGLEGMHLYEGGQDVFEAAYLADYAARRAPRLRYVLLSASYGLERLDHAAITSADLTGMRRRIYARTAVPRFLAGDGQLWLSAVFSPVARPDHWSGVAGRVLRPNFPRPAVRLSDDGRALEPSPPLLSRDSLARNARARASGHLALGDESLVNDPTTPARATALLERLARDLQARGVRLVLYTPPYHETYLQYLARSRDQTRQALRPLLKHPNVVWLDFGADHAFTRRDDLFRDGDHMNPAGARAFSTILRRCLAALPAQGGAEIPAGCRRVPPPTGK
jgi:hypothetical protein